MNEAVRSDPSLFFLSIPREKDLGLRSRGRWFGTLRRHCVVTLTKTLYPLLCTASV